MSILIKKMEMPKGCWACPFAVGKHYECLFTKKSSNCGLITRPSDCPLIEVPTPHGRLIDKDKLRRELFVNFNGERIPFYDCDNFPTTLTYRDLHSILAEQPTIIEAEGSKE